MSFLIEPWTWGPWMVRAFAGSTLVAVLCSSIGVLLYLRRLSLLADALSHVALPGIVLAFAISGSLNPLVLLLGAVLLGGFTAWSSETLGEQRKMRSDAAIGIVFTTLFALGVIASSTLLRDVHLDVEHMLFGNVLGLTKAILWVLVLFALGTCLTIAVLYRTWVVTSFDPGFARQVGMPVRGLHYLLAAMAAAATMASFDAVGAILVLGFMVIPAIFAHQFARSLAGMFGYAALHATGSSLAGMYVAVWFDVSPAGMMVTIGGLVLTLALLTRCPIERFWASRSASPRVSDSGATGAGGTGGVALSSGTTSRRDARDANARGTDGRFNPMPG